jgi:pentatricopeptide repeat protein
VPEAEPGSSSSSINGSSSSSTHELPYVRNGWYSPPEGPSSSGDRGGAANGAVPLGRGGAANAGPGRRRQPQQQGFYGGAASAAAAAQVAADKARSMDYSETQAGEVVAVYEALCDAGDLDEALTVIKGCIRASRTDVLARRASRHRLASARQRNGLAAAACTLHCRWKPLRRPSWRPAPTLCSPLPPCLSSRLKHYRFLRPAARRKAVKPALRFVQLLPRQYADARTYNMLLRVCAQAGDLRNAMHVADMLQAAGLRMDAILYTTLISGAWVWGGGGGGLGGGAKEGGWGGGARRRKGGGRAPWREWIEEPQAGAGGGRGCQGRSSSSLAV